MKIKVSEATNNQIDWLVTICEGFDALAYEIKRKAQNRPSWQAAPLWSVSTNWEQAGPIIEREGITLSKTAHGFWEAYKRPAPLEECYQVHDAPLIAAMRCYVFSKMGEVVEIPDDLI